MYISVISPLLYHVYLLLLCLSQSASTPRLTPRVESKRIFCVPQQWHNRSLIGQIAYQVSSRPIIPPEIAWCCTMWNSLLFVKIVYPLVWLLKVYWFGLSISSTPRINLGWNIPNCLSVSFPTEYQGEGGIPNRDTWDNRSISDFLDCFRIIFFFLVLLIFLHAVFYAPLLRKASIIYLFPHTVLFV